MLLSTLLSLSSLFIHECSTLSSLFFQKFVFLSCVSLSSSNNAYSVSQTFSLTFLFLNILFFDKFRCFKTQDFFPNNLFSFHWFWCALTNINRLFFFHSCFADYLFFISVLLCIMLTAKSWQVQLLGELFTLGLI